jgi:hypothetical protein
MSSTIAGGRESSRARGARRRTIVSAVVVKNRLRASGSGGDRLLRQHTGRGLTTNEKADDPGRELLQTCFDLLDVDIDVTSAIRR